VLRFFLEFLRGDPDRADWLGFSEAQWTSLLLSFVISILQWRSLLPHSGMHGLAAAGIALAMTAVGLVRRRRRAPLHRLLHPTHISELAHAIAIPNRPDGIAVASTSLGVRISGGYLASRGASIRHYTISCAATPLDASSARRLAHLIGQLSGATRPARLVPGQNDSVFHLLIEEGVGPSDVNQG